MCITVKQMMQIEENGHQMGFLRKFMMENAGGFSINEQLKNFLGHFFESKGSNVRITKIDY